jgi:tryptophan synthase alpha chain
MNRIHELFSRKRSDVLSVYFTAGYPSIDHTLPLARAAESSGADMIEIGIPFSDPIADGPVIQRCNTTALANGMSMKRLFIQLAGLRKNVSAAVVLMGYFNPVLQYGIKRFLDDCTSCGVDGIIVPDWPLDEFEVHASACRSRNLSASFLVSPQTAESRVRRIDRLSDGFIYAISAFGTTGQAAITDETLLFLQRLKAMRLHNPIMVGFGIRRRDDIEKLRSYCTGVIVGSALLENLSITRPAESARQFIRSLRQTA